MRRPLLLLSLLVLVVTWTVSSICIQRYRELRAGEDLTMFDQMLWNAREGRDLQCSLSGDRYFQRPHHFFEEHFSPILYLFAWPAGLTDTPAALLVSQALVFALAAFPLFFWVRRLTGSTGYGLLASLAWLGSPHLWLGLEYDFHMEAAGGLLLFGCLYAIWSRQSLWWLWAVLYCGTKEDAPVYLVVVGITLLIMAEHRKRAVLLVVLGATWFLAVRYFVIPSYSPVGVYLMGRRLITPESTGGVLPWFEAVMLNGDRWGALAAHLAHLGLIPLAGGLFALPAAAALGVAWLSVVPEHGVLRYHYVLPVYPLIFMSLAFGLRTIHTMRRGPSPKVRLAVVAIALVAGCASAWDKIGNALEIEDVVRVTRPWKPLDRVRAMAAMIPEGASVTAEANLTPLFSRFSSVHLIYKPIARSDWLFTYMSCDDLRQISDVACEYWLNELASGDTFYNLAATDGASISLYQLSPPSTANRWIADRAAAQMEAERMEDHHGRRERDPFAWNERAHHVSPRSPRGLAVRGRINPGSGDHVARLRVRTRTEGTAGYAAIMTTNGEQEISRVTLPGDLAEYTEVELPFTLREGGPVHIVVASESPGDLWIDRVAWHRDDPQEYLPLIVGDTARR